MIVEKQNNPYRKELVSIDHLDNLSEVTDSDDECVLDLEELGEVEEKVDNY